MGEILTAQEVALLLKLHPRTVMKMAISGEIPAAKVGRKWRFDRRIVENWLSSQMARAKQEAKEAKPAPLHSMLSQKQIVILEPQSSSDEVLATLADKIDLQESEITTKELLDQLKEREDMFTTAMEGGVAFPHPRHPIADLREPALAVAIAPKGITFGASPGILTHVFVLVCSPNDKVHLNVLGQLARIFRRTDAAERLQACRNTGEIMEAFRRAESQA